MIRDRIRLRIIPYAVLQIIVAVAAIFGIDLRRIAHVAQNISRSLDAASKMPTDLLAEEGADKTETKPSE